MSRVSVENAGGRNRRPVWGRKDEEYIADFSLTAKKTLDEFEYKVFRFHYLLGADWKLCCRQMKLDRGNFFHAVYRIQQKMGRQLRELEPYALFPLDEYFGGSVRGTVTEKVKLLQMPELKVRKSLKPPIRKAA